MKLFDADRQLTSFKLPILKIVIFGSIFIAIFVFSRIITIKFSNHSIESIFRFFKVILIFADLYCLYAAFGELIYTSENIAKQKRTNNCNKLYYERYKFNDILALLDREDVLEFEIIQGGELISIGVSSNSYIDGPLFNKMYYVGNNYYNRSSFCEIIESYMTNNTLKIVSVDGVSIRSDKRLHLYQVK